MVRYVVTLGSPFAGDAGDQRNPLYEAMSGEAVEEDSELRRAMQAICRCRHVDLFAHRWHRQLANLLLRPRRRRNIEVRLAVMSGWA